MAANLARGSRRPKPGAPERFGGRRPSAELAQSPRGTGSGASAPRDGGPGSHLDAVCLLNIYG